MRTAIVKKYKKFKADNEQFIGEPLEAKLARIVANKEPIEANITMCYTEESDGILPAHNPRTDRFEIAMEAMQQATTIKKAEAAAKIAKTEGLSGTEEEKTDAQ